MEATMRHFSIAVTAAASALAYSQIALAADMPVKAPPPIAAASSGNWYFWIDGMYENVRLPSYALGIHNIGDTSLLDAGAAQNFNQTLNGGGVRGALGYMMPGSGLRFEVGGSYVTAKGSSSQTTALTADAAPVLLNGANPGGAVLGAFLCNSVGGFTCSTAGTLSATYDAWEINGKVAVDRKFGAVMVTPSLAVFGGNTHNDQNLSQTFTQFLTGATFRTGTYSASTALRWTDAGARAGLDFSVPVTGALTFAVGGWVGGASRTVSLTGSDISTFSIAAFNGTSTVSAGDSKGVLLANGEVGVAYTFNPIVTLRGFGGVNYDGSVPGVVGPSLTGNIGAPTTRTPAGIGYAAETSYYAGGGFAARF
jgi:hypothetical protein